MITNSELRSGLSSLDGEAGELIYLIETLDEDEDCTELMEKLHDIQNEITEIQQAQKWI